MAWHRGLNEEAPVLGAPAPRRWAAAPGGLGTAGKAHTEPAATRSILACRTPGSQRPSVHGDRLAPGGSGRLSGGYRSAATSAHPPGAAASASSTARRSVARVNGFWTKARLRARAPLRTSTSSVWPDM
jgi:hypothetical protein